MEAKGVGERFGTALAGMAVARAEKEEGGGVGDVAWTEQGH